MEKMVMHYGDLRGTVEEAQLRAKIRYLLKFHDIVNGVLEADLVSMILDEKENWNG